MCTIEIEYIIRMRRTRFYSTKVQRHLLSGHTEHSGCISSDMEMLDDISHMTANASFHGILFIHLYHMYCLVGVHRRT
jgi:hypothetical protein